MNNSEIKYQNLIRELQSLNSIRPGEKLVNRLELLKENLPGQQKNYFPFLAIRPVLIALILLIITGSGLVIASRNSQPGDILYPVKTLSGSLFDDKVIPLSPTPTLTPSPTPIPKGTVPEMGTVPEKANPDTEQEIILEIEVPEIIPPVPPSITPVLGVDILLPSPTLSPLPVSLNINIGGLKIGL